MVSTLRLWKVLTVLALYTLDQVVAKRFEFRQDDSSVTAFSSLRRDYYLSKDLYDESFVKQNPNSGGRGHIVFSSTTTFKNYTSPLTISFNSGKIVAKLTSTFNLATTGLDWIHCDIKQNTQIGTTTFAVTFHTQSDTVLSDLGTTIDSIVDANSQTLVSNVEFELPSVGSDFNSNYPIWVTYVATQDDFNKFFIHLHNYDKNNSYTISNLYLNDVLLDTNISLNTQSHLLKIYSDVNTTYNLFFNEGDVWTVGLQVSRDDDGEDGGDGGDGDDGDDGEHLLGWGGRLMKEFIAFESYSKGGQCPFPGANNTNYQLFWDDLHIQTGFCQTGDSICDASDLNTIFEACLQTDNSASDSHYKILVGQHWTEKANNLESKYYDAIIGLEMGDEVDSHYNNTYEQWGYSLDRRLWYPSLMTYQGSHVNHYVGAFAGITDIQSCDYYVAGCQPHVTADISPMRIQGARDYLFNTRENHKPLVTWGYTQAFDTNTPLHGNELQVQLASVFAAGCKGVQLFQSDVKAKKSDDDAWNDASHIMASFYVIREYLRIGDLMEMEILVNGKEIENETPEMINVIRSDNMLIVIVISTNCDGYDENTCEVKVNNHWEWKSLSIDEIQITFGKGFSLSESNDNIISEVSNGNINNSTNNVVNGVTLEYSNANDYFTLKNVDLGENPTTVRIFLVSGKNH